MHSRRLFTILAIAAATALGRSSDFEATVLPLLEANCLTCHDELSKKGDLDLSRFLTEDEVMADREVWAAVYEKIESHQMPPPKEDAQPTEADRAALLAWIEDIAGRPDPVLEARDPGKPVLRRLTRLEYNNTVRDLFGIDLDVFIFPERLNFGDRSYFQPASGAMGDQVRVPMREYGGKYQVLVPQAGLPGDNRAEYGYRNRGEAMDFSPLLLEKYVQLAGEIVNAAELPIRSPKFAALLGMPESSLGFSPKAEDGDLGLKPKLLSSFAPDIETIPDAAGNAIPLADFRKQIAEAHAEGRGGVIDLPATLSNTTLAGKGGLLKARFGDRLVTVNPNADLWLVDFATARESSAPLLMANKTKGEKVYELTFEIHGTDEGEGIERLGVCVLGRKNQSGPVTLIATLTDDTETAVTAEIAEGPAGTTFVSFSSIPGESIRRLRVDGSKFSGDHVLIDDLGFITDGKPQPAALLTRQAEEPVPPKPAPRPTAPAAKQAPRERLAVFVREAFRRPVEDAEVDRFFALYENASQAGKDEAAAMRLAAQAVLSSPGFLFHEMNGRPAEGATVSKLEDFELANRLAYFLWSSLPDAELMSAAESGKLTSDPAELERQARRLLRDPRSKELSESFATQWLRLDQLYTSKPDPDLFKAYYSGPQGKSTLHASSLIEPLLLFETVLVEDRSILDLIDPGWSWLNESLVKLYGLETSAIPALQNPDKATTDTGTREVGRKKDSGAEWHRVPLPDGSRGGVLTMSGPLTVTSLPFRTSPVKRGAWLLETIFNRPPTEPKVAFVIENDTKEAALAMSVRQKFEDHRSKAACFSCHIRLDPPGFALESFDPIGAWREQDAGSAIDDGGEWGGARFDGPAEFKKLLTEDPKEFTRGFVEHLLSYALSRELEIYDMPAVTEIQRAAEADGWKFSTVIAEIAKSYPFTHVRTTAETEQPQRKERVQ